MTTITHQPSEYACPFCSIVAGQDNEGGWTKQSDIVLRDTLATAFLAADWWAANYGQVLVVPNGHYENVYSIPDQALAAVQILGKRIAVAIRATYGCDGTSFRQHNEPAGNQDVWHYHLHVFPRYVGDDLYMRRGRERRLMTPAERLPYAQKLRDYLAAPGNAPPHPTMAPLYPHGPPAPSPASGRGGAGTVPLGPGHTCERPDPFGCAQGKLRQPDRPRRG